MSRFCVHVPIVFSLLLSACASARPPVPVGTIPQPAPITVQEENYGQQVLKTLTQKWELDYNHPRYPNVLEVVERLTKAVGADKDPWHVYVLKDDSFKNAAATRGNHVFVWTGMINATQTDDELATIIGHEIGHVLARHSDPDKNESLRSALIQVGSIAAGIAVAQVMRNPSLANDAGRIASQLSEKVGNAIAVYPFSRDRELEADHIGMFLMAEAKYNPQAAVQFWTRAATDPTFSSSLAFFSTHPPAADRLDRLKAILPDAQQRYRDRLAGIRRAKPGSDSFNVGSILPPEPPAQSSKPYTPALSSGGSGSGLAWQVVVPRTYLLVKPQKGARRIGEFSQGTIVTSGEERNGWVHISRPDDGYLRSKDLTPIDIGKR